MKQPTEIKVNSTKILTTLVFLLTLFSGIPAFALFFDFDNNKKIARMEGKGWKMEGRKRCICWRRTQRCRRYHLDW